MTKILRHRSVQIALIIGLYLLTASLLPQDIHRGFYTFSLLIKDSLLWLLPITVGFFLAHAISSFEKKAPLFLITLLLFETVSNSCSVWYGYGCSYISAGTFSTVLGETHSNDFFTPLWRLPLLRPSWWSADKGTFVGILLGLLSTFFFPSLKHFISQGKSLAEKLLTHFFSRLIPLFVLGFVARMNQTKLLGQFSAYADVFFWLILFLSVYVIFLFLLGNGFSFKKTLLSIKNLLPATGVAFSSGCSLSTLPWTMEGTAKNLKQSDFAKAIIPATTNIQQVGDCITNAFLCALLCYYFKGSLPDLQIWIPFSFIFVLARFATAAVIGGAIFIMLPLYESYLGFTPEMTAMILAFNVILDPLVTSTNVIGNGALCALFEKVWTRVSFLQKSSKSPFVHKI